MNDIKPTTSVPVPAYYIDNRDDEISLVDLFLVLYRRKWVVLGTLLLCAALAVPAALLSPVKTTYTTTLKIGGEPRLESNASAATKFRESYIPLTQDAVKDDATLAGLSMEARAPDSSDLVILETETELPQADPVKQLHNMAAQRFIAEHQAQLDQARVAIENQIERLRLTLENLNNSGYLTTLREDVASLRQQFLESDALSEDKKSALKDELRFLQTKLIEEEQAAATRTIEIETRINELHYQLETLPKTALISLALETDRQRTSPLMIIALGIILGGMLGIFAAFMMEFLGKVKAEDQKRRTEEAPT